MTGVKALELKFGADVNARESHGNRFAGAPVFPSRGPNVPW
jgi:hypothetical protein